MEAKIRILVLLIVFLFSVSSFVGSLLHYIRVFGFLRGIELKCKFRFSKGSEIEITLSKLKYPLILRAKTSDIFVFEQIFLTEDYELGISIDPKFIIDGGANVGCSTAYFANKYPHAIVVAVEPEESNYYMLVRNTSQYSNVLSYRTAIWNEETFLQVKDYGFGKWGFMVEKSHATSGSELKSTTICGLMRMHNCDFIDILKLDVEGSEKEIFKSNYDEWLGRVGLLIIELHDRLVSGCSEVFYSAMNNFSFSCFERGENLVFVNNSWCFRNNAEKLQIAKLTG